MTDIRLLDRGDAALLADAAADVFDGPIRWDMLREFLADPRHHLAVAIQGGRVVGAASAVHYVHPDKGPELWINEVGVAPACRREGIGRRLLEVLLAHAGTLGCREAWVLTEPDNVPAMRLYEAVGGERPANDPVIYSFPVPTPAP